MTPPQTTTARTATRTTTVPRVPGRDAAEAVHHEVDPTVRDGGEDVAMGGGQEDIVDGAFDMDMGFIGSLQPSLDDCVAELLLAQLGAGRRYVREHRQGARKIISEIYSPPASRKKLRKVDGST